MLIGDGDGEATLARLRALAATGQPWSQEDRLDLALLPVLRHGRDTETVVREGLELARALPAAEQPRANRGRSYLTICPNGGKWRVAGLGVSLRRGSRV